LGPTCQLVSANSLVYLLS